MTLICEPYHSIQELTSAYLTHGVSPIATPTNQHKCLLVGRSTNHPLDIGLNLSLDGTATEGIFSVRSIG
jgi:hypothetical protein